MTTNVFELCVYNMKSIFKLLLNSLRTDLSESNKVAVDDTESVASVDTVYVSDDDKRECVINDAKFGMFSMFAYAWNRNKQHDENIYCSKVFTTACALPILVFISQWMMFISIVIHQYRLYINGACPQDAPVESKMLMFAVSLLYFVNSFFLWDDVVDRTNKRKMIPAASVVVLLDSFQEFSFSLFVYISNLLIVMVTDSIPDMLFNCLALEFVMSLDNEFERIYFGLHLEDAIDIYDTMFVYKQENRHLVEEKMKESSVYCVCRTVSWLPFKILTILFMVLPIFCLFMMVIGTICK
jgi:hypothetical protein